MSEIQTEHHSRAAAIRNEAYMRAQSWLACLPRAWRPLDTLVQQIAQSLGREYMRVVRAIPKPERTGRTGRKLLAKEIVKWLHSRGECETHTTATGRRLFIIVRTPHQQSIMARPEASTHWLIGETALTIRDCNIGDHLQISSIDYECDDPWGLPNPKGVFRCPNGRGVVAVVGGVVVGYAIYSVAKAIDYAPVSTSEMKRFGVAARWRRMGIGTLLLQTAQARAIREGMESSAMGLAVMHIAVPESCLPVQKMCRSLGYAAAGDRVILRGKYKRSDAYHLVRQDTWDLLPTPPNRG